MPALISIVIPNYNKAGFIADSLQSVINQTYPHWEALVVDDGSTDNSINIIESYVRQDSRFKLFRQLKAVNGGSVCRNIGLKHAKGEFVIFFDSDDLLEPFCLETRHRFMLENSVLEFAVFPMRTFKETIGDNDYIWQPKKEKAFERFLSHDLPWQTMQPIYRTAFLKNSNLQFDEHFPRMQDVEFHTSVLLTQPNFEIAVNKPDCYFRINPNRKVLNADQFYTQWSSSAFLFYQKFYNPLQNKKYLYQTLLMAISELITAKNNGELKSKRIKDLVTEHSIKYNHKLDNILKVYLLFGLLLPFHLKGLRYFFLKLIQIKH